MKQMFSSISDLIRILEPISVPNQSRDSFILINWILCPQEKSLLASWGNILLSIIIGHNFMKQMFSSIQVFDTDSRSHLRSESVRRFIYSKILNTLSTGEEFVSFLGNWVSSVLLDITLWSRCFSSISGFDSDSRAHFRSDQSRDSFILIKLNTLSTGEEFVRFKWKYTFKYLKWTKLYEADVFLQFRVLIRILEPISVPISPEIHLF